jgi:hypothetical protein
MNKIKGDYKSECNMKNCTNSRAIFLNHATNKYYCAKHAMKLNNGNHLEAMKLYGHALCTLIKTKNK